MLQFQLSDQLKQSATRWNNGDLEGFLQDYYQGDQMTFTSGGRILQGFEALEQRYRKAYGDSTETMGTLSFNERFAERTALTFSAPGVFQTVGCDRGRAGS